jgi:hypothetical protein
MIDIFLTKYIAYRREDPRKKGFKVGSKCGQTRSR